VGLLDTLLGRTKPVKSKSEALFAMATAQITLETKLHLTPAHRAGVVFRPVESSYFDEAEQQLQAMLGQSGKDENLKYETQTDSYGYRWIIVENESFEELVAALHMVSITLADQGFGDQLLAAGFRFDTADHPVYWDLQLQARRVLPVRAGAGRKATRQRRGASPRGGDRQGAAGRKGNGPLVRALGHPLLSWSRPTAAVDRLYWMHLIE